MNTPKLTKKQQIKAYREQIQRIGTWYPEGLFSRKVQPLLKIIFAKIDKIKNS